MRLSSTITDDEITHVCELIATGQSYVPVPRCGRVLLACMHLGLFDDPTRAVPTLTPAGLARAEGRPYP
jgi:hypothetical protein